MNVPEGAVGVVGATLTTYTTPNNVFDKQLFRVLYGYNAGGQIHYEGHLGLLHNWAKLEMLKDYYGLGGWEYAIHNLLTYLLLGDPSLWILPLDDKYISCEEGGSIISKNENSIQDFLEQPTLTLYPNPVYDILSLDINTKQLGEVELKVYDISGRLVTTKNYMLGIGGSSHAFDLTNLGLESGVYIIHLTAPGLSESRKIVFAP